ncbi:ATP-binding protein [Streptomyces paromomycinus]|uniref:ATPase n=1 Tax=Streptomyces paromomycinus TaxID=92743 RepID=A0A401W1Y9_STREY|nr:ATP-binding protein [Streptomyces paromomycinus]GCD43343.1 ATPase [Streptomyces paromomycinus]
MPLHAVTPLRHPAYRHGNWEYSLRLPHSPLSPGVARATVRLVLDRYSLDELGDRAQLLASELATNCYLHAPGPARLRLSWEDGVVRMSMWDTGRPLPGIAEHPTPAQVGAGRGLHLVGACADDWGWYALDPNRLGVDGKIVWCELYR